MMIGIVLAMATSALFLVERRRRLASAELVARAAHELRGPLTAMEMASDMLDRDFELLDPKQVRNLVVPGRVGTVGSQSVVFLGKEAADIFNDLRDDAVIGGAGPATTTTTEPPSTTTTTAVAPQATTSSVPSVFRTSTTSTTAPSSSTSSTEPGDSPHP